MPAARPLAPDAIRDHLLAKDYELIAADDYNWAFAPKGDTKAEPVIVPTRSTWCR